MKKVTGNFKHKAAVAVPALESAPKHKAPTSKGSLATAKQSPQKKKLVVNPKKDIPEYTARSNSLYQDLVGEDNNNREVVITGTNPSNPIVSPQTSLLVHQGSDPFGVDIEASVPQYGATSLATEINDTAGFLSSLGPWTPVKVYTLFAILIILAILTLVLYLTGHTQVLSFIWSKIFCWLGVSSCNSTKSALIEAEHQKMI